MAGMQESAAILNPRLKPNLEFPRNSDFISTLILRFAMHHRGFELRSGFAALPQVLQPLLTRTSVSTATIPNVFVQANGPIVISPITRVSKE